MEAPARQALKDINTNSPSVKRQKLNNTTTREDDLERQAHYGHHHHHHQQQQQQQQRIQEGHHLESWQKKWRSIMKTTTVYFDLSNAQDLSNKEREMANKLFQGAGATVAPFFDNNVTIVISKRPKSMLPKNMVSNDIKVWDYEKVFRFFKNLGERVVPDRNTSHLSTMWQDEKLHGVADRDPSAKRDDIHYFKYPFFHVYDVRDIAKPVASREWRPKEKWPQLHRSSCGYSLFQEDPTDVMDERKVKRRKMKERQNAAYRQQLREIYATKKTKSLDEDIFNFGMSEDSTVHTRDEVDTTANRDPEQSGINENQQGEEPQHMPPPLPSFTRPPVLSRQTSALTNKFIEMTKRDHGEIQASGYNGSVSAQSTEYQTRNGLAPTVSTVSSKQINTLQRKVIKKPVSTNTGHSSKSNQKEKVPGYCENCKIHFDDFDEHIVSLKHREFATDPSNFEAIDNLIVELGQYIKRGQ